MITDEFVIYYFGLDKEICNIKKNLDLCCIESEEQLKNEIVAVAFSMTSYECKEDGILYYINGNNINLINEVDYLKLLWNSCNRFGYVKGKRILAYFIVMYGFALNSKGYKYFNEIKKKFFRNFNHDWYDGTSDLNKSALDFFSDYLDFLIHEDDTFFLDIFEDFLPVYYQKYRNNDEYNYLIERLLEYQNSLSYLFDYDSNRKDHMTSYNRYIVDSLTLEKDNSYKYDNVIKLSKKMSNEEILNFDILKYVINFIVDYSNKIIMDIKEDQDMAIRIVFFVDELLKWINMVKGFKNLPLKMKQKMDECITKILYMKRNYIIDKGDGMFTSVHTFDLDIPHESIEKVKDEFKECKEMLYTFLSCDFDKSLKESIINHSQSPLIDLVTWSTIDTSRGLYRNVENEDGEFCKYYNDLGIKITRSISGQLKNTYKGNFYLLLLKNLQRDFSLKGQFYYFYLKEDLKRELIAYLVNDVFDNEKTDSLHNEYVMCSYLLVQIEQITYSILKDEYLVGKMNKNMNQLFKKYLDNKGYRNGFMFVYYTLYQKDGLCLRNNFMHGNLLYKKDFMFELMYIYACYSIMYTIWCDIECKN